MIENGNTVEMVTATFKRDDRGQPIRTSHPIELDPQISTSTSTTKTTTTTTSTTTTTKTSTSTSGAKRVFFDFTLFLFLHFLINE